jgi:nitroreductase
MNEVMKCLLERRSCRSYLPKQVEEEALQQILLAGTYAPSGMARQPVKIVVLQDPKDIAELEAMNAAIAADNDYGPPTLLKKLIAQHFGYPEDDLHNAIFSIYDNTDLSPVAQVASCAPLVSQAARAQDPVACDILRKTGEILGKQAVALIRKQKLPDHLPMTISGSVWRSHRILFDSFAELIGAQCPTRPILIPEFEPILGIMIRHYLLLNGHFAEEEAALFRKLYPQFAFRMNL